MSIFSAITITFLSVLVMALTATLYVVSPKKDPDFKDSEEGEIAEFNQNFLGDKVTEFSYINEHKKFREAAKADIEAKLKKRQELIDEFENAELGEMTQLRLAITTLEADVNVDINKYLHLNEYLPFDQSLELYTKNKDNDYIMDNYLKWLKDHEKDLEDMGK